MKERLLAALVIGSVTVASDFFFHAFFSSPFEIWPYFTFKFVAGFAVGLAAPELGWLWGALVFTGLVDVYYGAVWLLNLQGLTVSPTAVIPILGLPNQGWINQGFLTGLWTLFHALFWMLGYGLAYAAELID